MNNNKESNLPDNTLWFTCCACNGQGSVPTASDIAYSQGWLQEEFVKDNIKLRTLQCDDCVAFRHHHFDHELQTLIREGGNLFALSEKEQGADTKLIGLNWIKEPQFIIVRPDSNINKAEDLRGKRLALPISRHSILLGYKGVLASGGLTLDDVRLVEVGQFERTCSSGRYGGLQASLDALKGGRVDAIYVKGVTAKQRALDQGLVVGIDLDKLPDKHFRVISSTLRPVTVHTYLLENHYDIVVRFLTQILRAAEWAKTNFKGVCEILQRDAGSASDDVAVYRDGFHLSLVPDLSKERVGLFLQQKDFLLTNGILDRDFDFDDWIDFRPIEDAKEALFTINLYEELFKKAA